MKPGSLIAIPHLGLLVGFSLFGLRSVRALEKRVKLIAVIATACLLSGCAGSVIGDALNPEGVAEREDGYCKSIGLQFGTPEYASCRMNLQAQTNANHQRAIGSAMQGMRDIANSPPAGTPSITVYNR